MTITTFTRKKDYITYKVNVINHYDFILKKMIIYQLQFRIFEKLIRHKKQKDALNWYL
jgi:hypothetical protein